MQRTDHHAHSELGSVGEVIELQQAFGALSPSPAAIGLDKVERPLSLMRARLMRHGIDIHPLYQAAQDMVEKAVGISGVEFAPRCGGGGRHAEGRVVARVQRGGDEESRRCERSGAHRSYVCAT